MTDDQDLPENSGLSTGGPRRRHGDRLDENGGTLAVDLVGNLAATGDGLTCRTASLPLATHPGAALQAPSFTNGYTTGLPNRIATVTANHGTTNVLTTSKTYAPLDRLTQVTAVGILADTFSSHAYDYNAYDYNARNQRTKATLADASYWDDSYDDLAQVAGGVKKTVAGTPVAPPTQSQRLGETFFVPLPVDNAAAPFVGQAEVTAVLPAAAPGGEDIVAAESRPVRIPQATQTLTYDLDGNLASDGLWTYTWNAENRLVEMLADTKRLQFMYDSMGRRFRKTSYSGSAILGWTVETDTLYLYDNWNLVAELDANASNAPVRTHLWGTDLSGSPQGAGGVGGLLSSTKHEAPSTTHYACYDGNGNLTAYVDAATVAKSATFDYDPFGNTVVAEGANLADLKFRFSTKYLDETGMYYYGRRSYSPEIGRWIGDVPVIAETLRRSFLRWRHCIPSLAQCKSCSWLSGDALKSGRSSNFTLSG